MEITPPHMHWQIEPAASAGCPEIFVVGEPGCHGPVGTGTQGIGVRVPSAAAVADATVGFDRLVHIANGGMFMPGTMLVMTAAGRPSMVTVACGRADKVDGAVPKVHSNEAPVTAFGGMESPYFFEPLTEALRVPPVVVTKQMIVRSLSCSQLRADGSR